VSNLAVSDDFDAASLPLAWQWNHNPDNEHWSLTERPGFLRISTARLSPPPNITTPPLTPIYYARNTLTQRSFEPAFAAPNAEASAASIALEFDGMKDGDVAGFAALQHKYGFAGIAVENGQKFIVMRCAPNTDGVETERAKVPFTGAGSRVYFKIACEFPADRASFYYSTDAATWQSIGQPLSMSIELKHDTGYRFALFYYSTQTAGGHADFDYFHLE
ncbi:MAG: hypothetical protein LBD48_11545, partial [Treponema sp.]|nr:hypothetical protein [Treponema sp.]